MDPFCSQSGLFSFLDLFFGGQAPTLLTYTGSPYTVTNGLPINTIAPTMTGQATSCSSSPTLPQALVLDQTTCSISGTPNNNQPLTNYTITASNRNGSTSAKIGIIINSNPPSGLTYSVSSFVFTAGYAITSVIPSVIGTVTSCTSDIPLPSGLSLSTSCAITGTPSAVQSITNYMITASNLYGNATPVSISITIIPAPVVNLAVAGLQTGDTLMVTELVHSSGTPVTITGPSPATATFPLPQAGGNYSFKIGTFTNGSPGTNTDKVCAMQQVQYGLSTVPVTLNVNCAAGYLNAQSINAVSSAKLDYRLFQGKVSQLATGVSNAASIVHYNGLLYIADSVNDRIVTTPVTGGPLTTLIPAGTTFNSIAISGPRGLVIDGTNLYFADGGNQRIIKTDLTGAFLGSFALGTVSPAIPSGLVMDHSNQKLYVMVRFTNTILSIDLKTGVVSNFVTSGINDPESGVILNGNLYVTNYGGNNIVQIPLAAPTPIVFAGSTNGYQDGPNLSAKFFGPHGITTDGKDLYIADLFNFKVRRINTKTGIVSTIAGSTAGSGTGVGVSGQLNSPYGITTDGKSFYVVDSSTVRKITDNGIVGYWPLAGNTNDYASDVTTAQNISTTTGAPTITNGRYSEANGAYNFDGSSYFTAANTNLPTGSSPRSLCAWIKPSVLPTSSWDVIFGYGTNSNSQANSLGLYNMGGVNHVQYMGWSNNLDATYTVSTTEWTHLCGTFDANKVANLYINGKKMASSTMASWNTGTASALYIGTQINNNGSETFNGSLADVRIYNRALNESEINELAQDASPGLVGNSYNVGATGLLSHYSFDGSLGTPSLLDNGPLGTSLSGSGAVAVNGKDGDPSGAYHYTSTYSTTASAGLPLEASARTICSWISPASLPALNNNSVFFSYGTDISAKAFAIGYRNNGGTMQFRFFGGGSSDNFINDSLPVNTWSHICVSYDGNNTLAFYRNGSLLGTADRSGLPLATAQGTNLYLAAYTSGTNSYNGKIDDIRIYNNALNATQIRQLATQVPNGLVAMYDFSGDTKDISGNGNHLVLGSGSSSPVLTTNRFGQSNSAYQFSNQWLKTTTVMGFPTGNAARSICAWYNASGSYGAFNGIANYGGSGTDTIGMNVTNSKTASLYLSAGGTTPSSSFVQTNIWNFACAVDHGNNTQSFYYNGNYINGASATLNTINPIVYVGNLGADSNYNPFNGVIDDVRIYNRALTINEIQALVQEPNKKIQVTTNTFTGDLINATAGPYVNGILGADAICEMDFGPNYKAMIVDALGNRQACLSGDLNCATNGITKNIDWVLRPNITYVRSDLITPIFQADWNGVFASWSFINSIDGGASLPVWTGLDQNWTINIGNTCTDWSTTGGSGTVGRSGDIGNTAIFNSGDASLACNNSNHLYCVEQ